MLTPFGTRLTAAQRSLGLPAVRYVTTNARNIAHSLIECAPLLFVMFYTGVALMSIGIRSFAKINLGLKIGPARPDGFHELRTIYQTLALHDLIQVDVQPGSGIEIRCNNPRVPLDQSNTCYKVANRVLNTAKAKVLVQIDKRLPVQGGLGAGSSNAVATMLGLEQALETKISPRDKMRIAAEIGSDVPLFLIGGTILGVGHGEEVYPLQDLPRCT